MTRFILGSIKYNTPLNKVSLKESINETMHFGIESKCRDDKLGHAIDFLSWMQYFCSALLRMKEVLIKLNFI